MGTKDVSLMFFFILDGFAFLISSNVVAFQSVGECQKKIPFVIMTSDDTHSRTVQLLESNSYFGMEPTQVKLLKQVWMAIDALLEKTQYICNHDNVKFWHWLQEKVACLDDNDARLALDTHNKYRIQVAFLHG